MHRHSVTWFLGCVLLYFLMGCKIPDTPIFFESKQTIEHHIRNQLYMRSAEPLFLNVYRADLNQDGIRDVLTITMRPWMGSSYILTLFDGKTGKEQTTDHFISRSGVEPHIELLDLTCDAIPEVLLKYGTHEEHRDVYALQIMQWNKNRLRTVFRHPISITSTQRTTPTRSFWHIQVQRGMQHGCTHEILVSKGYIRDPQKTLYTAAPSIHKKPDSTTQRYIYNKRLNTYQK